MIDDSAKEDDFSVFFQKDTFIAEALFPTPFLSASIVNHEAVNAALSARILARESIERSVSISNYGGWHSNEFLSWCGPEGKMIIDAGRQMANRMTLRDTQKELVPAEIDWRVSAWANVNRTGNGNKAHGHPMAYWSGVYWVDDGGIIQDPALGGMLEVSDPRGIVAAMYAPHLRFAVKDCLNDGGIQAITPKAGVMVMFPSWLIHAVAPYTGDKTRISIAFNLSLA